MADTIIQTRKTQARKPGVSFVLSLFFPGLGQMYNGDLAGGIAFALLRTVALLAPPLWAAASRPLSCVGVFIVFIFVVIVLTFASPVEALVRARRNRELPVRRYSAALPYIVFAIADTVITCIAVMVVAAFFSVQVPDVFRAGPLLSAGDVVLVRHYVPEGPRRGDLSVLDDGSVARIIAREGDRVAYVNNVFYVNGRNLPLGYLADHVIARFTADREEVVSEAGDAVSYPVRFKQSQAITLRGIGGVMRKGTLLVASDTRLDSDFARIIPASSLRGRVEGVLFSTFLRKIGISPFGDL